MSFLDRFRRKKVEDEASRRARLLLKGRITEGTILDVMCDESGGVSEVFFTYTIHGVNYRATQSLTEEQRHRLKSYIPSANITVRYDPHRPGNSVVV